MHALLGINKKKKNIRNPDGILQELYKLFYEPARCEPENDDAHLIYVDLVEAKRILVAGTAKQKIKLLNDLGHNLWIAKEETILNRLELIKSGLYDSDTFVQGEALDVFVLGGRVVGGVSMVVDFIDSMLANPEKASRLILKQAVQSASCLLHETYYFNREANMLLRDFGTTDVDKIYRVSNGNINQAQFEAIRKLSDVRPQRHWTSEHQRMLTTALNNVIDFVSESTGYKDVASECERVLLEYPMVEV